MRRSRKQVQPARPWEAPCHNPLNRRQAPYIAPRRHPREAVPVVGARQQYRWPDAIGEITDALVAFNGGDILLESGLHPKVFAGHPYGLNVTTMMLYADDEAVVGVCDANCGYGGDDPYAARDLLSAFGFAHADVTLKSRFVHLRPGEIVR